MPSASVSFQAMIDLSTKWWHRLARVLIWTVTGIVFLLSLIIAWSTHTEHEDSFTLDFEPGYTNAPGEITLLKHVGSWVLTDDEIANRLKKFAPIGIGQFSLTNHPVRYGDLVLAEAEGKIGPKSEAALVKARGGDSDIPSLRELLEGEGVMVKWQRTAHFNYAALWLLLVAPIAYLILRLIYKVVLYVAYGKELHGKELSLPDTR